MDTEGFQETWLSGPLMVMAFGQCLFWLTSDSIPDFGSHWTLQKESALNSALYICYNVYGQLLLFPKETEGTEDKVWRKKQNNDRESVPRETL